MRKTILITIAFAVLMIGPALAASTTKDYCDINPTYDCICRKQVGQDAEGNPVWQEIQDVIIGSTWANNYCISTEEYGPTMWQNRTTFRISKPDCETRIEMKEYRLNPDPLCKKCPDPKLLGSWQQIQCAGTKTVFQREVLAYYYTPNVTECELGQFIELKTEDQGICTMPGGGVALSAINGWMYIVIGIIIAAVSLIAYMKWKGR